MGSTSKVTQNDPSNSPLTVDDSEIEPPEDLESQLRKQAEAENSAAQRKGRPFRDNDQTDYSRSLGFRKRKAPATQGW